ncbi:hypothetical protein TWF718_005319 [Orbilia javanica]|uniref:Uncharacterized protein n=1 Tax=Orbilia javanica TaxID=47235 RepID=A0AAN8MPS1_9PEZI
MEMHACVPISLSDYLKLEFVENPETKVDTETNQQLPEKFQIYFCAEDSCGRDIAITIKSDNINTDRDLFQRLRHEYAEIRGWMLWFSFTHVHDIRFVRLWRGYYAFLRKDEESPWALFWRTKPFVSRSPDFCDIKADSLPSIEDDEYSIAHHLPPNWVIRPMSREAIMDHFSNPNGGKPNASDCLRYAIPKKLTPTSRSGFSELYGLHAQEAICPAKVLFWGLVAHVFCIGGFVPWWGISVVYFGIVLGIVVMRAGRRKRFGYRYEVVFDGLP